MNDLKHVAIIMDGNGRWAKKQGFLKRVVGHEEGAKRVRELTIHAQNIGLKYLTLYAFSTENWKRSEEEISFLFKLMDRYLKKEKKMFLDNGVKFETIGNLDALPKYLQKTIFDMKEITKDFDGLTQVLAVNYGSQDEIVRAVNRAVELKKDVDIESFSSLLDTKSFDEVDLLIRTGGDVRVSNFLLWQCAYAEMFFEDTLWPEFTIEKFDMIVEKFKTRDRRFGGVK